MEKLNSTLNLEGLKHDLAENPAATHALLRRRDGVLVDVPLHNAEMTIRRHEDWVFEGVSVPQIELSVRKRQQEQEELPILPAKPSEEAPLKDVQNAIGALQKREQEILSGKVPAGTVGQMAGIPVEVSRPIRPSELLNGTKYPDGCDVSDIALGAGHTYLIGCEKYSGAGGQTVTTPIEAALPTTPKPKAKRKSRAKPKL